MEENEVKAISFVAHEADMARMERANVRWFRLALIELVVIIAMIVGFAVYENQYETVEETTTQTVTQDVTNGDGSTSVKGLIGDIYGESEADGEDNQNETLSQKEEKINDKSR